MMKVNSVGEGQGQDDDERPAEAPQEEVEDEDDEQGADDEGFGHGVDAALDDVRALVEGHDLQPGRAGRLPALISATRSSTAGRPRGCWPRGAS